MNEQLRIIPAREPGEIIERAIKLHDPSKAFVLFSGGKDSSVTLDYMWRNHADIVSGVLHINTGIGLQSTTQFVREFCGDRGIPYHEAHAPVSYEDLVRRGYWSKERKERIAGFPAAGAHWFTYTMLKERALEAFVNVQKATRWEREGDCVMLITGVRATESLRRMGNCVDVVREQKVTKGRTHLGSKLWVAPLIDYTDRDMQEHRTVYSVPMSPASSAIHFSGECYCGAFGDQSELSLVQAVFPDDPLVPRIRRLEKEQESLGVTRCKWSVKVSDEKPLDIAPGPLCVGCYKNPEPIGEDAA